MRSEQEIRDSIAWKIRAELVCCRLYDEIQESVRIQRRANPELTHDQAFGTAMARALLQRRWHEICYWSEAAAKIAETPDNEETT